MWNIYLKRGNILKYYKHSFSEEMAMEECRETNYKHTDESGITWEMRIIKDGY